MSFTDSSVLIQTDTGSTHNYQTAQSSPLSVAIPPGSTGAWTWVVSREGYSTQIGTFDVTGGGVDSASPVPQQLAQANGAVLFTGSTSANVSVVFDLTGGAEKCFIGIGDGAATAQQVIDEIETALLTEDGCKFLIASNGSQSTFSILAGQTYLLLGSQYRVRRESAGDVNASIEAFVISADGTPLDGVNGGVQFLTESEGLTAQEIYDLFTLNTNADAFKADVFALQTTADADTKQTALIGEIDANETKIDAINTAIANLPIPLTAGQVNSQVDAALADYDAPTKAELDTAESNLLTAIGSSGTNPADIYTYFTDTGRPDPFRNTLTAAQIRTELTTELARLDVAVSSVAYNDTALTALVNALPTLAQMEASAALTEVADITGLSTHDAAAVVTAMQAVSADFKDKNTEVEIHSALDNYTNKDDYKADAATLDLSPVQTVVDAILVDTDELQQNQVNFATATGFSTPADVTTAQTNVINAIPTPAQIEAALLNEGDGQQLIDAIVTLVNSNLDLPALELQAIAQQVRVELATELARIDASVSSRSSHASPDLSGIETKAQADIRQAALISEHDATQVAIGGLENFTLNQISDAILSRGVENVEDVAGIHTLAGFVLALFESQRVGNSWTVRKTDGTTLATKTITTDPNAEPVTGVD